MDKVKLTNICHKVSKEKGLTFNSILVYFFLESILHRLNKSPYQKDFIFKGGLLLSNMVGVDSRCTVDIDFLLRNQEFSSEKIVTILEEALSDNQKDEIKYKIQGITTIKEKDQYNGFRVSIHCRLENIRQIVPLDIATGDRITPYPDDYKYVSIFGNEDIIIKAYNIETIIAEKIQTIYSKGFLNSRSKDYYDLYILYKLRKHKINTSILIKACEKTFEHRGTEFNSSKIRDLLVRLKYEGVFLKRWESYVNRNAYAGGVDFKDVIDNALKLIDEIEDLIH